MYGAPDLIDMPSADVLPDGQIQLTFSGFADFNKSSVAFQMSPRLTGVLRYSGLSNYASGGGRVLDRSFDLHYQLLPETKHTPAIAIGLRDFMGTSIYSAQYLVASKQVRPALRATLGLGWSRLSGTHQLQPLDTGTGGVPAFDQWFRGPVGVFGGLVWETPIEGLTVKVEYSSDLYTRENNVLGDATLSSVPSFTRHSDINVALSYRFQSGANVELSYLYGDQIGVQFSGFTNPRTRKTGYYDIAPLPIQGRGPAMHQSTDWIDRDGIKALAANQLADLLARDGARLMGLSIDAQEVRIWIDNRKYSVPAQAIGRAARAMARVFPDSVDHFEIILVRNGLSLSRVALDRTDLETLEHADRKIEKIAQRSHVDDPPALATAEITPARYPQFSWSWGPYAQINFSDFNDQFGIDGGVRLRGRIHLSPKLSFGGSLIKTFESDKTPPVGPSSLPRVRSNLGLYNAVGDPGLETLTLDYTFKPAPAVYGRISVGLLESMFGGISGEILWKSASQNWGLGLELNAVKQRDFDRRFGFQNYSIVTGHISGYFELSNEVTAQLDLGRYLAGDWGGTLTIERRFANGWRVGAFATLTDVDRDSFGEGSFDKGIFVEIPLTTLTSTPTQASLETGFRSVNADGGARLNVENRLYEMIRDGHFRRISGSFGRFWQ
ncbi:MAG: YjbH domain-containing protein [Pseudomonadota bacterium]